MPACCSLILSGGDFQASRTPRPRGEWRFSPIFAAKSLFWLLESNWDRSFVMSYWRYRLFIIAGPFDACWSARRIRALNLGGETARKRWRPMLDGRAVAGYHRRTALSVGGAVLPSLERSVSIEAWCSSIW